MYIAQIYKCYFDLTMKAKKLLSFEKIIDNAEQFLMIYGF